jgi:hypothetical protein
MKQWRQKLALLIVYNARSWNVMTRLYRARQMQAPKNETHPSLQKTNNYAIAAASTT